MGEMRLAADFENLTEVRASLEAAADGLGRALAEGIAQDAQPLLATTRALTPYNAGPRPLQGAPEGSNDATLDHVRDMLSVRVLGGTVAIIATHPGAVVHEWGGTIAPRGVPIKFKPQAMARRAAVAHLPEIERAIEARIERIL